jgi:hypothetical protein
MSAPLNNKYWQFRLKHGRDFKYTPEKLWEEAIAYFEWIEANPLKEEKGYAYMGEVTKESFNKMHAMTIAGFCLFADINDDTFYEYEKNKDFTEVIMAIKKIIFEQKFTGAAADLLNANIISRELGLIDKIEQVGVQRQEITVTSKDTAKEIDKLKKKFESE